MPKVSDINQYWAELAKKNGISDDDVKPILEALGKENLRKVFTDHFKPLPDYSHDLDEVREKARKDKDKEYEDWYLKEKAKYDEYVAAEARLKEYEAKYGSISQPPVRSGETSMTKEDIDALLEARLTETLTKRDSAYMDLLEVREQHMSTFKKPLDVKTFEDTWRQHPEWGSSMKAAYKFYTEPEMEKIREAEWNTRIQQKYDEGVRDGFSRRSLPTDSASKEFSPMFDRKEDVAKLSELEQERHSRSAFFEGLREGSKPA